MAKDLLTPFIPDHLENLVKKIHYETSFAVLGATYHAVGIHFGIQMLGRSAKTVGVESSVFFGIAKDPNAAQSISQINPATPGKDSDGLVGLRIEVATDTLTSPRIKSLAILGKLSAKESLAVLNVFAKCIGSGVQNDLLKQIAQDSKS